MNPDFPPSTAPTSSTTALGRSLLAAPVMRPWPPSIEEARAILAGQPYEVIEPIGHGGMGAVFKVHNMEPGMGRIEAVKIRRPEARDDDLFRERFLREIGTLAGLRHPGITTIYRSGDSDEGYLWFSMEYIEGQTLAELLNEGMPALPPERVLDITRQLCITLQFIHKEGRLHRDLKPANVMVCEDGSVRLLDFGIARSSDPADPAAASLLTGQGDNAHTPEYAAPEQKNGGSIDQRTDLYGLGRIINEMIRLDGPSTRQSSKNYPQRLLDLVDDLLAFDQRSRPDSAADVFEKLGQIEPGSPGFWGKDRCPFRGLEAYQPEHAEIFYGRDAAIRRGREILTTDQETPWNGFLLIIGASGSGKSSLARAGLGPALLQKEDSSDDAAGKTSPVIFDLCAIRAEDECLLPPLARSLAAAIPGTDPAQLAEGLRNPGTDLAPLLGLNSRHDSEIQLCLILDQFEHFFRQSLPRSAKNRFVATISRIARVPGVAVLTTLRSDFYHHCAEHPALMDLKESHQLDLTVPQSWEIAAMLRLGARASGLRFECLPDGRGLDDVLLDQARKNPQTLPLLSYVLEQLWERRDRENGVLRMSDYEELGGIEGAVAAKATQTFNRFSQDYPEKPDDCLDKLFRLVVETSDSSDTPAFVRRLATYDEIAASDPDVRSLAERFVASRLFVTTGDSENSDGGLTLAHECLLHVWPRAVAWAENNRDFLRTRTRIGMRMKEGSPLLEGDPLLEAARTHTLRQPESFTPKQLEFVRNATSAIEAKARRTKRRRRLTLAVLSILAVIATVGATISWQMKNVAEQQRAKVTQQRDEQDELLWTASRSDHEAALRAFGENNKIEGLAYLDRASGYRPANIAVATTSAIHAYCFDQPDWRTRSLINLKCEVMSVTFSANGRYLAVEGKDNTLQVIESSTGTEIGKLSFGDRVSSVSFSPDDRLLAAGSDDNTVRMIEIATGREIGRVECADDVNSISFSPDGRHLAVGSDDNTVRVIEVSTCDVTINIECDDDVILVNYSSDGRLLEVASIGAGSNQARLIESKTGKEMLKMALGDHVRSVCFSPDGRHVAILKDAYKGEVRVVALADGKELLKKESGVGPERVCYSPDGRFLLIDNMLYSCLIDVATGRTISASQLQGLLSSSCLSPDGRHFAMGANYETLRVIDVETGTPTCSLRCGDDVTSISFSPDGRYLAVGSDDNAARVVEVATGKVISKLVFGDRVSSICFSPDGRYLAAGSLDNTARVLEAATGPSVSRIVLRTPVTAVGFGPNGRFLIAGTDKDQKEIQAKAIDASDGRLIKNVPREGVNEMSGPPKKMEQVAPQTGESATRMGSGYADPIGYIGTDTGRKLVVVTNPQSNEMIFSPDGRRLAAAMSGPWLIYETEEFNVIGSAPFNGGVVSARFNSDGRYLAAACGDNTARVLEVASGTEICKVECDSDATSVDFSTDGRLLAVGSRDGIARVVEVRTGNLVCRTKCGSLVNAVSFSPDGRHLAAGCGMMTERTNSYVLLIDIPTGMVTGKVLFEDRVTSVSSSPDGRWFVIGSDDNTARVVEVSSGKVIGKAELDDNVTFVCFSPNGRWVAAACSDHTVHVIEPETGNSISRMKFRDSVSSVSFSPDGRWLAAGSADHTSRVMDCEWLAATGVVSNPWRCALRIQSGFKFRSSGELAPMSGEELIAAQSEVTEFISAEPKPSERWQHSILAWAQLKPDERTTSPWGKEPIRFAVGRGLMQTELVLSAITDYADQAPWHPLEPLSLARLEPRPVLSGVAPASAELTPDEQLPAAPAGVKSGAPSAPKGFEVEPKVVEPPPIQPTDPATREAMMRRQRFLARLTLKRLHEADEKLYDGETLAEYAAWSAKIMHEELHLVSEALEAVEFALERTPKDKQQSLLGLKAKLIGDKN